MFLLTRRIRVEARKNENHIPILMYHNIVTDPNETKPPLITITDKRFKRDMEYLKNNGYTTISFRELIDYKSGKGTLPKKPVVITFDDGLYSNYKYAYPILRENNMKATIFIIGSRVGKDTLSGRPIVPHFNWNEAKEMYDSGLIEIQPHTYNLHFFKESSTHGHGALPMTGESEKNHYDRFLKDTKKIKKLIKDNIGCESYVFAYPYGDYTATNEKVLKDLNFKSTLTTRSRYSDITDNLYGLKRINVPSHIELKDLLRKIRY